MDKAHSSVGSSASDFQADDLFMSLAEQVKLPFMQIAYAAELLEGTVDQTQIEHLRRSIALSSQGALRLIDGYLLSISMQRQGQLELEPVSVSSVLYDSAQALQPFARAYGCELRLEVGGKYEPVMAHRGAVQSALIALGYSFIEAATNHEADESPVVSLMVRRNQSGISTGVFSNNANMSSVLLKRARALRGKVHQPLADFESGNGTGIFIADALFSQLQTAMKVTHARGLHGLAATFAPSRQLSLV